MRNQSGKVLTWMHDQTDVHVKVLTWMHDQISDVDVLLSEFLGKVFSKKE